MPAEERGGDRTLDVHILARSEVRGCEHRAHRQQCILGHLEFCQLALYGHPCPLKVPQLPAMTIENHIYESHSDKFEYL